MHYLWRPVRQRVSYTYNRLRLPPFALAYNEANTVVVLIRGTSTIPIDLFVVYCRPFGHQTALCFPMLVP